MRGWMCFILGMASGAAFATLALACLLANRLSEEQTCREAEGNEPRRG